MIYKNIKSMFLLKINEKNFKLEGKIYQYIVIIYWPNNLYFIFQENLHRNLNIKNKYCI